MPASGEQAAPAVTAVMPAFNEERSIAAAIESVLGQAYDGALDLVVAIAPSSDRTLEVVSDLAARDDRITVVDNPSGRTPSGLNAAIAAATGDVIVRCDAHAKLPDGYVATAVALLQETGAANVGGIQRAAGSGAVQRAIAIAMSSPFGVGDARFHTGGTAGFVDTVYLGVFRRDAIEAVGGFDETLIRNQDYELNYRLREAGGGVYFDPTLEVRYEPRASLVELWRQYYGYGRWKRVVIRRHPGSTRWRQLVAPTFVLGLGLSGVALAFGRPGLAGIIPGAYLVTTLSVTVFECARRRDVGALVLPAVFPMMHLAWGVGFLAPGRPSGAAP